MGTRGFIGVWDKNSHPAAEKIHFKGVYHHWDSYPDGLGATLYKLYRGHFKRDMAKMLDFLTKQHTCWSTINKCDFKLPAGYSDYIDEKQGPVCYCHGNRSEKGWVVTEKNASGSGCEWGYILCPRTKTMSIVCSYYGDASEKHKGKKMIGMFGCGDKSAVWKVVAVVKLGGKKPDFKAIKDQARAKEIA